MTKTTSALKWVAAGALVLAAFFGAYTFAQAKSGSTVDPGVYAAAGVGSPAAPTQVAAGTAAAGSGGAPAGSSGSAASGGCSCCGSTQPTENGVTGPETPGAAVAAGGVQKISVDVSKGYYEPNVIKLKAGVPAQITFGQSSGCTAQVQSADLGFQADLSAGPQVVEVAAAKPGTYTFACGMNMVFGKIVVE